MSSDFQRGTPSAAKASQLALIGKDGILTDAAVVSSIGLWDLWPLGLVLGLFFLALDVVCFAGQRDISSSLLFSAGALVFPFTLLLNPAMPWDAGFRAFTGIDTRGMPDSPIQVKIREVLSSWPLRWEAAGIASIPLLMPWLTILGSSLFGWKGIERVRMAFQPWLLPFVFGSGASLGFGGSFAGSFSARAARRVVDPVAIKGFGSIGFSLRSYGVSRRKAILWFFLGLVMVSIYGYCTGVANRHARERQLTEPAR